MGNTQAQFVAYLINPQDSGFLYAKIDNNYHRIVSPTTENSYVVTFDSYNEMMDDIDALKRVNEGLICYQDRNYTPYDDFKFNNLVGMLQAQGRLASPMCA